MGFLSHHRVYEKLGARTFLFSEGGVAYLVDEFWMSSQRQAHEFHEVSHRACFKPQLPVFSSRSDRAWDNVDARFTR